MRDSAKAEEKTPSGFALDPNTYLDLRDMGFVRYEKAGVVAYHASTRLVYVQDSALVLRLKTLMIGA